MQNIGRLNVDGRPYAILIPMADIPKERLKGEPNDMYVVNGGVEITPNSYILCPQGKGKEIKEKNYSYFKRKNYTVKKQSEEQKEENENRQEYSCL